MNDVLPAAQADALQAIRRALERDPRLASSNSRRGYLSDLSSFESWRRGRPVTRLVIEEHAATIAIAWTTGMRRAELAALDLEDIRWLNTENDPQADLIVKRAKGGRSRTAYVFNGAAAALLDWLAIRGRDPGRVFLAINKGSRILRCGISTEAIAQILTKRSEAAGVSLPTTWHDFRRTFAGNLLDQGADIVTVQKLLGHASPSTTAIYDRRGEEVRRGAVRSLFVPCHRAAHALRNDAEIAYGAYPAQDLV